jgi:circadian clock protein KaiC
VVLQYIRDGSTVRRALTVLKTRASRHEPEIREFKITREGILLGDPFDPEQRFD